MTTDVSVRDINDSNLARSDIGRWLRMQHPFGLPRAATADVHRLRLCVARSFFSLLFFFFFYSTESTRWYATCLRANVRVSFIFTQRYRRISAGIALGCSIPDRLKGFTTLEKEEISKSIVPRAIVEMRRMCDSERVVVYSGTVDLCLGVNALTWLWTVICRSAWRVKPERV